jgi:molybdenum cofactor synthesis domain-containing protein
MKSVKVEDAVGMVLAHDLTKIVPDVFKGVAFKKGTIIREEDIEELKNMGKYNVFVVSLLEGDVHENEAAERIATAAASSGMVLCEAKEGKVNIKAGKNGILKVNKTVLEEINQIGNAVLVTMHDNTLVEEGKIVAAAKIIPLTIEEEIIKRAENILVLNKPVIDIKPVYSLKTGIIVTGSEVFYGRIQDKFGIQLRDKVRHYGGEPMEICYAPDDEDIISAEIKGAIEKGAQVVLISGGMAVDADDVTPKSIESIASRVVTYGLPVLPGAMCMLAYAGEVLLMGVPACAMFSKTTFLDIIYPRALTKEPLRKEDLRMLGHGGLCLQCDICHYPVCPFGK